MGDPHHCPSRNDARNELVAAGQPHRSDRARLPEVDLATGGRPAVGNACNVRKYILYRV